MSICQDPCDRPGRLSIPARESGQVQDREIQEPDARAGWIVTGPTGSKKAGPYTDRDTALDALIQLSEYSVYDDCVYNVWRYVGDPDDYDDPDDGWELWQEGLATYEEAVDAVIEDSDFKLESGTYNGVTCYWVEDLIEGTTDGPYDNETDAREALLSSADRYDIEEIEGDSYYVVDPDGQQVGGTYPDREDAQEALPEKDPDHALELQGAMEYYLLDKVKEREKGGEEFDYDDWVDRPWVLNGPFASELSALKALVDRGEQRVESKQIAQWWTSREKDGTVDEYAVGPHSSESEALAAAIEDGQHSFLVSWYPGGVTVSFDGEVLSAPAGGWGGFNDIRRRVVKEHTDYDVWREELTVWYTVGRFGRRGQGYYRDDNEGELRAYRSVESEDAFLRVEEVDTQQEQILVKDNNGNLRTISPSDLERRGRGVPAPDSDVEEKKDEEEQTDEDSKYFARYTVVARDVEEVYVTEDGVQEEQPGGGEPFLKVQRWKRALFFDSQNNKYYEFEYLPDEELESVESYLSQYGM